MDSPYRGSRNSIPFLLIGQTIIISFKQWGIHRSGTNFTRALLQQNFAGHPVFMSCLGGKHSSYITPEDGLAMQQRPDGKMKIGNRVVAYPPGFLARALAGRIVNVITVRNPWACAVSYAEHLKREPESTWLQDQCRRWSDLYRDWLQDIPEQDRVFVSHEELIVRPALVLERLAEEFSLEIPIAWHVPRLKLGIGNDKVGLKWTTHAFDIEYCRNQLYLKKLSHKAGDTIARRCYDTLQSLQAVIPRDIYNQYYLLQTSAVDPQQQK